MLLDSQNTDTGSYADGDGQPDADPASHFGGTETMAHYKCKRLRSNWADANMKLALAAVRSVWDKAATPANVKAGFEATGIFPFNPDRIPEEVYAPSIPTHNFAEPGASPSENQENGDTNDSDATNLLIPPQENEDTNESHVTDASGNSPYPLPNEDKGNSNPSNDSSDSQPSQAKRCAATPDNASDDHPQHPNQEDISNFIEPLPSVYDDYDSSDHIPLSKLKQHNNNIESKTELNVVCSTTLNESYTSLCQMLKTPEKTSSPKTAPRAKAINSLAQALTKSMFTDKNNMSGPSNAPKQKIEDIPGPFKVAYQKRKYSAKRNNSEAVTPKKVSKQSRGKGQSEKSKDSWYCYVCNEDRIADMRICFLCETYVHEDCVGLTKEDTDKFVCTRCSLD
ncbi:unnamed protein product [Acanthoscelides obtectus]|uniref:Zinc finger PHD-type domain-containing protein n=1 Tax=Acanthoscelides obtectus TaxID=200917 RepID=A0A9P0LM72_ACAOB|nr:unnamed protein product [Acanthoscelides obtectus]CAK1626075.1 hypothetical protein AOBTE_LOCUS3585 [Acanthoscelides obtectus]